MEYVTFLQNAVAANVWVFNVLIVPFHLPLRGTISEGTPAIPLLWR